MGKIIVPISVLIFCLSLVLGGCYTKVIDNLDETEVSELTEEASESVKETRSLFDYPYDSTESFGGPPKEREHTLVFMDNVYGTYLVTEVLKSNGYSMKDSSATEEEADLMIGKEIVIRNDFFLTYDNFVQRPAEAYTQDELNQIEDADQRISAKYDGKPEVFRALVEYPYYVWSNSNEDEEKYANPSVIKNYGDRKQYDYIQVRPGFMDSKIEIDPDILDSTHRIPGFWVIDENTVLLECMGWLFKAERIIDRGEE